MSFTAANCATQENTQYAQAHHRRNFDCKVLVKSRLMSDLKQRKVNIAVFVSVTKCRKDLSAFIQEQMRNLRLWLPFGLSTLLRSLAMVDAGVQAAKLEGYDIG